MNFTFATNGYVPSTGFTVNATAQQDSATPGNVSLQLYCAPSPGQALNDSASLPSQATAVGTTSKCQLTGNSSRSYTHVIVNLKRDRSNTLLQALGANLLHAGYSVIVHDCAGCTQLRMCCDQYCCQLTAHDSVHPMRLHTILHCGGACV